MAARSDGHTQVQTHLKARCLVACHIIGQQTGGQAAAEHCAMSGAHDRHGKRAQLAEAIKEI